MPIDVFDDDGVTIDPHSLGQQAAQSADIKPVAPIAPPKVPDMTPPPPSPPLVPAPGEPVDVLADEPAIQSRELPASPSRAAMSDPDFGANEEAQRAKNAADYQTNMNALRQSLNGAKVDPSQGLPGFAPNAETSLILHTPEARASYLQSKGMDAKVGTLADGSKVTMWRQPGEEAYHPIIGPGSVSGSAGRAMSYVPDAAEAALALATDGTSIPLLAARTGVAGAAMDAAANTIGSYQGYNKMTPSNIASSAATTGALDAAPVAALPVGLKMLAGTPAAASWLAGKAVDGAKAIGGTPVRSLLDALQPILENESGAAGEAAKSDGSSIADMIKKYTTTNVKGEANRPFSEFQGPMPEVAANVDYRGSRAAKALAQSAADEGAPALTAGQLDAASGNGGGVLAARQNQLLSTNPGLRERILQPQKDWLYNQTIAKRNALTGNSEPPELTDSAIASLLASNVAQAQKESGIFNPGVDWVTGGQAAQDAVKGSVKTTGDTVGKAYDALGDAGADTGLYDINPVQEAIQAANTGTPARGKQIQVPSRLVSSDGAPLTTNTTAPDASSTALPESRLRSLFDNIMTRDPAQAPYKGTSGFDTLKNYRTQLNHYESQNYQNAPDRSQLNISKNIRGSLTNAMENPAAGVPDTEAYKQALAAANSANTTREQYLGNPTIQSLMDTKNPEEVKALFKPGNYTALSQLNQYGDPQKMQILKDAFKTDLLADPSATAAKLDAFKEDPKSLGLWMSPEEAEGARQFSSQVNSINNSDLAKLSGDTALANRLPSMLAKNPKALADQVASVPGGKDSGFGLSARAAVFQHLLNESAEQYAGLPSANPRAFATAATRLMQNGSLDGIFTPQEMHTVSNMLTYSKGISGPTNDVATGLMKGELAKGLGEWLFPPTFMKHLGGLGFNAIQARTLTSPTVANALYGGGVSLTPNSSARTAAALLGGTLNDMRRQEPNIQPPAQ